MSKGNGKAIDFTQAILMLSDEISEMRKEIKELPEKTAGRAVHLLFEQMRGLNQEDFLKLKFASAFPLEEKENGI